MKPATVVVVLSAALLLWEIGVRLFHSFAADPAGTLRDLLAFLETPGLFMRHLGFTLGMTSSDLPWPSCSESHWPSHRLFALLERTIYTLLVALNSIPRWRWRRCS